MPAKPKAVVLLSGGLDSATVVAIAKSRGFDVYAMTFDYGQRHDFEIKAAQLAAGDLGVTEHVITKIDTHAFSGSALTRDVDVPKGRSLEEMSVGIPVTYVPARNTIFLSLALGWAEVIGVTDIFIGVNALDYSGYPDCRPEFIAAFQQMARLATKAGVEGSKLTIHTPLISMTKAEIIAKGLKLGVDFSITNSCYDPSHEGKACAQCDACFLRLKGFEENGVQDPAQYQRTMDRNAGQPDYSVADSFPRKSNSAST